MEHPISPQGKYVKRNRYLRKRQTRR